MADKNFILTEDDPTGKGIKTLKISLAGLIITALFQVVIVLISGSTALLADTIHNFADALTSIPLWIAFVYARRKPTRSLTYGYGRLEDIAGIIIILVILFSALVALNESIKKFLAPEEILMPGWVMAAGVIGFLGNEIVAHYRIKTGKEIGSAALVADGKHSRIDGLTSLAVVFAAAGSMLGYHIIDPVAAMIISFFIFGIVIETTKEIFKRLMDIVDPNLIAKVEKTASTVPGLKSVHDVRARWIGHKLRVDISIAVDDELSVKDGHNVAIKVHRTLVEKIPHLKDITIHVDPASEIGEGKH
jgi:cation diffusion facilitator family transporter